MKDKHILKAFEVLAGRIIELESEASVSAFRIGKLNEIIEKAEQEAKKAAATCGSVGRDRRR